MAKRDAHSSATHTAIPFHWPAFLLRGPPPVQPPRRSAGTSPNFRQAQKNAVSGPALSHSTLPDTARSLCFGPNPAASSAIPVTGSILCISECTPGIGVSYHGCFVIIGRLLPQDKMCCLAGCFRFPLAAISNFCMTAPHDGRKQTQIRSGRLIF